MTWLFRVGGVLLAAFGAWCVLVGTVGAFEPHWSRPIYLLGGVLSLLAGAFHAFATVEYGEPGDGD